MAITRRQNPASGTYNQAAGSPVQVSATWPAATAAGSTLVAVLGVSIISESTSTHTAPAGWAEVDRVDNDGNTAVAIYVVENAASRSGAETFTKSGFARDMTLTLLEYASDVGVIQLVTTGTGSTGTGTSPATDALAPPAAGALLRLAGISNRNNSTQSNPTNSFTEIAETMSPNATAGNRVNTAVYQRIDASSSASVACGATINQSRPWAALGLVLMEVLDEPEPAEGQFSGFLGFTGGFTGVRRSAGGFTGDLSATAEASTTRESRGGFEGGHELAGAAAGQRESRGAFTGHLATTGTATTSRASRGAFTGSIASTAAAVGRRLSVGRFGGLLGWTGHASGDSPAVGSAAGSFGGQLGLTGGFTGHRASRGTGTGAVALHGSAGGRRASRAGFSGALGHTGTTEGRRVARGAFSGVLTWLGGFLGADPGQDRDLVAERLPDQLQADRLPEQLTAVRVTELTSVRLPDPLTSRRLP